jgi:hypothetical protein
MIPNREMKAFLARCEAAAAAFPLWVLDDARNVVRGTMDDWLAMKLDFDNRCRVASTIVGDTHVSTVFLGINHNFLDDDHPITFETMIFAPDRSEVVDRYATWAEAAAGHAKAVAGLQEQRQ